MKRVHIFLFFIITCINASIAGNSSAGGDGVIIGEKYYLLDFVEENIHESTYFKDKNAFSVPVAEKIAEKLKIEMSDAKLVAAKLSEVFDILPIYEFLLKWKLFQLNWIFAPHKLIDIDDEDLMIEFKNHELIQLAGRKNQRVFISQEGWNKLNAENRAGLILHEVIYALLASLHPDKKGLSHSVRYLTASLFSDRMAQINTNIMLHLLRIDGIYVYLGDNSLSNPKAVFVRNDLGYLLRNWGIVFGIRHPDKHSTNIGGFSESPQFPGAISLRRDYCSLPFNPLNPHSACFEPGQSKPLETFEYFNAILKGDLTKQHRLYSKDDLLMFEKK